MAHPVRPQSYQQISNFYTATVYSKGAEVVRMMQTLLGPAAFRAGIDLYFQRHDGHAVATDDLVQAMQDAGGIDLTQFKLWYEQSGTPRLQIEDRYDAASSTYELKVVQSCPATPGQPEKLPFHMPFSLGLLDAKGQELPLQLVGESAPQGSHRVLSLRQETEVFRFVRIPGPPVPSLGRNFSAPVIIQYDYSDEALALLFIFESDAFNRWEAGQALATDVLLEMAGIANSGIAPRPDPIYVEAIGEVLARAEEDHAFAAEVLMPPSESELALKMTPADPVAIHEARTALIRGLAEKHREAFDALYQNLNSSGPFVPDARSAGRRRLRNICLRYVTAEDTDTSAQIADAHYHSATNMTDMIAGLAALSRMDWPERETAFAHFHDRFVSDPLVLDKWMGLQASSPLPTTVMQVRSLMNDPSFDMKNPNRVRALVGAFSGNHLRFHEADGSGYSLVAETIRALDTINPQVAARMAAAFENWCRYDEKRQSLMRAELEAIIGQQGLSSNLFEVTTKMLR